MKKLNVSIKRKSFSTNTVKHEKVETQSKDRLTERSYPEEIKRISVKPIKTRKSGFHFPSIPRKALVISFGIIIFGAVAIFAYSRIQSYSVRVESFDESGNKVDTCSNILNPECWTEAFKPQLKQTDGYTNALVVGMDTREGSGSLLTDTIMIASYNQTTHKTMLLSIPRDFFDYTYKTKINSVIPYTYNKDKSDPYRYLKEEILKITGKQIHYVVRFRFKGVIDLVNDVGGVEVCPTAAFTAQYPNENVTKADPAQWKYYDFPKGCQQVNGEMALIYARFRHIRKGPSELASDFSRARRQQEVVNAVKDKLLSQDISMSERAENYWELLQTVDQNISFDFTFEDFLAGLSLLDTVDKKPASVVLDDTFGGNYKFIAPDNQPGEGWTIKSRDKTYKALQGELTNIWNNIDFYKEKPNILVRNQTGEKTLATDNSALKLKTDTKYWSAYNILNDAMATKYTKVKLVDFTGGTKPGTLAILKAALGVDTVELLPETYGVTRSNKNEDFLILVGPSELPTPTTAPETTTTN
jgi:LCP family protein required for cell wall assembly